MWRKRKSVLWLRATSGSNYNSCSFGTMGFFSLPFAEGLFRIAWCQKERVSIEHLPFNGEDLDTIRKWNDVIKVMTDEFNLFCILLN